MLNAHLPLFQGPAALLMLQQQQSDGLYDQQFLTGHSPTAHNWLMTTQSLESVKA